MNILATALAAGGAVFAATSAQAASIDVSPLINEAITDIAVPVLVATGPIIAGMLVMPLRRFLEQRSGDLLAGRVNDVLDKAIAFAAQEAQQWVSDKDFHANVNGWMVNIAADYAVSHAPTLMKQAGALASAKAADLLKQQASALLTQKITARLDDHPAVVALKAAAPATAQAA